MEITLNYDYREDDVRTLFDVEALAAHVIMAEGKPPNTEVSVNFVTDEAIHELNREYRGIDRPTDVLSFECDGYDDDDWDERASAAPTGFGVGGVFELGDIVVAPDVAERQAPEYGLSFADEMSLLVTHGLLHLCGYDHMTDEDAEQMEVREREILEQFWGRPFVRSAADAKIEGEVREAANGQESQLAAHWEAEGA